MHDIRTIDRQALERKLASGAPDTVSKSRGYVLINVLRPTDFAAQHIPRSINVPVEDIEVFDYDRGLSDWREAGNRLDGAHA